MKQIIRKAFECLKKLDEWEILPNHLSDIADKKAIEIRNYISDYQNKQKHTFRELQKVCYDYLNSDNQEKEMTELSEKYLMQYDTVSRFFMNIWGLVLSPVTC